MRHANRGIFAVVIRGGGIIRPGDAVRVKGGAAE